MRASNPTSADVPALLIARRRRLLRLLVVVLSVAVIAVGARPVYQMAKRQRARGFIFEAQKLIKAERWDAAAEKLRAASELAPGDFEALRLFAQLNTRIGHPRAGDLWKKLLEGKDASPQDRSEAIQYALKFERFSLAEEQIDAWLKMEPASIDALEFATRLATLQGDRERATDLSARIVALRPGHSFALLTQARLLFTLGDDVSKTRGRRLLEALAFGDSAVSLEALEMLAARVPLPDPVMPRIALSIQNHPRARPAVIMAGIAIEIALEPARREELLAGAIAKFNTPEALPALGRWMNEMGEHNRALDLVPSPAGSHELFAVRLDAMTALKMWPAIDAALNDKKAPLFPLQRALYTARSFSQRGDAEAADIQWNKAIENLQTPSELSYAAEFAQRAQAWAMAEKAYRKLARQPAWTRRACQELIPILHRQTNTASLRDVISELARLYPGEPAVQNNQAHLALLLNENIDAARASALELAHAFPKELKIQTTLALAWLRCGKPAAALEIYRDPKLRWGNLPAGFQAVRAAVFAANGEKEKGRELARAIPKTGLRAEEEELITELRR